MKNKVIFILRTAADHLHLGEEAEVVPLLHRHRRLVVAHPLVVEVHRLLPPLLFEIDHIKMLV